MGDSETSWCPRYVFDYNVRIVRAYLANVVCSV